MPAEVRVRVFARDRELRSWLVDELALISPTIEVHTSETIDAIASGIAELWIVGVDALTTPDEACLHELVAKRAAAVIAIGSLSPRLAHAPFACVLDAKLTSRQLKRAVRDALTTPAP